jgi:DNA-binding transcriptional ArsR family regulator
MKDRSHVRKPRAVSPRAAATECSPAVARVRETLLDRALVERLALTFRALGDPTRSRMVLALSIAELNVGELADVLGGSHSATSHQLRILRDLDIVHVRRLGKTQVYALNERAFGFCAPRTCHAWRQTLEIERPSEPGSTPGLGTRARVRTP